MTDPLWRVQKGSQLLGPFPLEQLQQLIQAGMVVATDPVNHETDNVWKPAGEFHELYPAVVESPPSEHHLVACHACRGTVLDQARTCPHCGADQPYLQHLNSQIDAGECEHCGTFNLIGTHWGILEGSCRGCGLNLKEAYPTATLAVSLDPINRRTAGFQFGIWKYLMLYGSPVAGMIFAVKICLFFNWQSLFMFACIGGLFLGLGLSIWLLQGIQWVFRSLAFSNDPVLRKKLEEALLQKGWLWDHLEESYLRSPRFPLRNGRYWNRSGYCSGYDFVIIK